MLGKQVVDASYGRDFDLRAGREDDAVHLEAFAFSARKDCFWLAVLVEELSSQAVAGRASLSSFSSRRPSARCPWGIARRSTVR